MPSSDREIQPETKISWGAGAAPDTEFEEVWDEDPTVPQEVVLGKPVDEADSLGEKEKLVRKKKRKGDVEQVWGEQRRVPLWWMTSGLVAVIVIGIFLKENEKQDAPGEVITEHQRFISETRIEITPVSELIAIGQSVIPQLVKTLSKVEGSTEGVEEFVLGGAESLARMQGWNAKMGRKAAVKEDGVIGLMAASIGDHGYLLMSGLRDDYSNYVAYFVQVDGELLLDWEATEGYSDLLPKEFIKLGESEVQARMLVSPSSFYSQIFPESEYLSVLLTHLDQEHYLWGYVRRDASDFELLSSYLSSPVTVVTAGRLILKLAKGPDEALSNQVEITGVTGIDWLTQSSLSERQELGNSQDLAE